MESRLIPVLQLDSRRRLVKTKGFGDRVYIGDPFNVVRLFNEKEVDEIVVLDIDATRENRAPDIGFISELATECFMPLAYGGALTDVRQCEALSRAGIEKCVIGSAATDFGFLTDLAASLGSQAVVACIDVKGAGSDVHAFTRSGSRSLGTPVAEYAQQLQDAGAGEIIVQSIDRDGERKGFDLDLIRWLAPQLSVPLVALGGAEGLGDLRAALGAGASAAASGSAFCFIGALRAVLVTYPDAADWKAAEA